MKGRPKTTRKISFMPAVSGFKPYGGVTERGKPSVFLFYEEYEALRLSDYENLSQCEAAVIMQVSRPTFTRIYRSAREKIAKAFVEGLRIVVEGGKVELDGDWYVCKKCKAVFSNEKGLARVCALCGSEEIEPYSLIAVSDEHGAESSSRGGQRSISKESLKFAPAAEERGCRRKRCRRAAEDQLNEKE